VEHEGGHGRVVACHFIIKLGKEEIEHSQQLK
jgi:hypothetical protein